MIFFFFLIIGKQAYLGYKGRKNCELFTMRNAKNNAE